MKILIVDDTCDDRSMLRCALEANGHEVMEACNGQEGLQTVSAYGFDLILSDVLMPVMDGFRFLRNLRVSSRVPFVFYSAAYGGKRDLQLATSLGANGFLVKPMDPLVLLEEIERIVVQEPRAHAVIIEEDVEYLKKYSQVVASKLEENVRELEEALAERKKNEEALRESEQKFRTLAENSPDNIIRYDTNCRAIYFNPNMEWTLGRPTEPSIGKTPVEAVGEAFREYQEKIERVIAKGENAEIDLLIPDTGEGIRHHHIRFTAERGAYGVITGALAIGRDITDRIRADEERQANLLFFELLDRVNRAIQQAGDLKRMIGDVLDEVLDIFGCDRAYLMHPCDPDAESWKIVMERTTPAYPGVLALGVDVIDGAEIAGKLRLLLDSGEPVKFGPGMPHEFQGETAERFRIRSLLAMAIHPKTGKPWEFGIHQCSHARSWTPLEERLLREIGRRLADGMTSLLIQGHLSDLALELSMSEERERRRIAIELHDTLGQDLALAKIKAGILNKQGLPEGQHKNLGEIRELLDNAICRVRSLTRLISPPILESSGLEAALKWMGRQMEEDYALQVEFSDDLSFKPVSHEFQLEIYNSVRELLINVAKHAGTDKVLLSIGREVDMLLVRIEDNGIGFDVDAAMNNPAPEGFGLFTIKRRIAHLGGSFIVNSAPGCGVRMTISVPVENSSQK